MVKLKRIAVGNNPSDIAITKNNLYAYVINNNNASIPNENTISVIDLKKNKVVKTITDPSFNGLYTIIINKKGDLAYVTNSYTTTISIINIKKNSVVGVINGFTGPSNIVINKNIAYVTNFDLNTISVVNLDNNTIINQITVGLSPAGIVLSNNKKTLYVINYNTGSENDGTISVIDVKRNIVINTITGFFGPFDIAISPKHHYAYVTNFGNNGFLPIGNTISVVDLKNNTIIKTITVVNQPTSIVFTPNGKYAYVANYNTIYNGINYTDLISGNGVINVIDTKTHSILPEAIITDYAPITLVFSNTNTNTITNTITNTNTNKHKLLYVTNYFSNNINIIKLNN